MGSMWLEQGLHSVQQLFTPSSCSEHPAAATTAAAAKSLQSCLTLCNPIHGNPPGSPIPGILQARTLEWVAVSFSQGILRGCLMERSGSTPTSFITISGVQPIGSTDNLLTLGALGQGLTQPCKPETQRHQCPGLTGSGMPTHSSPRQ